MLLPEGVFRPEAVAAMRELATAPMSGGFGATVLKALFAGWLIATMVWLLPSARSARLATILLVTYVVGARPTVAHHRGLGGSRVRGADQSRAFRRLRA